MESIFRETIMIAVIGAGVSGLSCAWWLQRHGMPVRVFEAAERVGGKVSTLAGEALCEQGPNTLLLDEELGQWLAELACRRCGLSKGAICGMCCSVGATGRCLPAPGN